MVLVVSSYIADLIFGDPEWFPHPVKTMGKLINFLDQRINKYDSILIGRIKGMALTFLVVGVSGLLAYILISISAKLNYVLGILVWVYLGYTTISIKDLFLKSRAVLLKLEENSPEEARLKLSHLVGRDTRNLPPDKIIKATIESIAESTNDGIIAPLFYLILAGPVAAIIYKAINTLDSMVGYKNEKYNNFGWFSAKIDDAANFIPARITGFLMPLASLILKKDFKNSFRAVLRDGKKHPSPNSGISEAAMAGALGIRLGGPSACQGQIEDKPYIAEDKVEIKPLLIKEALTISFATSLLMISIGILIKWAI